MECLGVRMGGHKEGLWKVGTEWFAAVISVSVEVKVVGGGGGCTGGCEEGGTVKRGGYENGILRAGIVGVTSSFVHGAWLSYCRSDPVKHNLISASVVF